MSQFQLPQNTADRPITVIGGGTLGSRIAAVFASGGAQVRLVDQADAARSRAASFVADTAPGLAEKLGRSRDDVHQLDTYDSADDAVPGSWLVVEAVPEKLDLKRSIFKNLDEVADADTLLATNSSSYASREVITDVQHPERVFNMHFAMPPTTMSVELMTDGQTADGVLEFTAEQLRRFGLHPFIAHKESTGFIFNRIWAAIKRESLEVVAEGVSTPEDVDALLKENMPLINEPFRAMDQVGLDVVLDIETHYTQEYSWLPHEARDFVKGYVDQGKLGRKTGEGFYRYDQDGDRK